MNEYVAGALLVLIIILLFAGCVFVYCTTPNKFRWYDLPVVFAHRGWHDNKEIPENSLPAFRKCAEKEIAAELDVQYTKDGEIVVFHDDDAKRLCGVDSEITEMTLDEIKALRLLGTDEKIPTFAEALSACGKVDIYCEIKTPTEAINEDFLTKIYEHISAYGGKVSIASFNPYVLRWFRENHPEIIRGQISASLKDKKGFAFFALSNLLTNFIAKPDFVSYRFTDKTLGMIFCRLYGTRMIAWTVRSLDEVEEAAYHGFSSFVGEGFDLTEV